MNHLRLVAEEERAEKPACRVKVWLSYTNGEKRTPYKWFCKCTCGWGGMSGSWWREYEVIQSGMTREQYIEECGEPEGGALVMALEHVGQAPKQVWVPMGPSLGASK